MAGEDKNFQPPFFLPKMAERRHFAFAPLVKFSSCGSKDGVPVKVLRVHGGVAALTFSFAVLYFSLKRNQHYAKKKIAFYTM